MADDTFRSYRNRDPLPRDEAERAESNANDPLAELARLIGQSDPYAEGRRSEAYGSYSAEPADSEAEADRDRADEGFAEEQYDRADDRYAPRQAESYPPYEPEPRAYQNEPPAGGGYLSGPAPQLGGFREDGDADYRAERMPVLRPQEFSAYPRASSDRDYEAEELDDGGETYAEQDYYDEPARPRRRTGLVVIMALLGLAVVGSAGAFGYRAMFGGSVLPTLPPIIKANEGPNKIMPSSDSQANNTGSPAGAASAGSAEHLVSREEQPVNMEAPKTVPRVVSTIPIVPGQSSQPPAWPNPPAGATQWPNPPAAAATPSTAAAQPAPAPVQDSAQSAAPAPPAQASTAPKRIHTVVIHSDQPGTADTAPASAQAQQPTSPPASQPAPRNATRPAPAAPATTPKPSAANAPSAGGNAPLSLVPSAQGEAAPAPAARPPHTPSAPMQVASAGSASAVAAAPSSGGGYAVQVTSQRSEAEAQAAFKELRAKFPNQLGGREPIIRRADLGAKGTYYRALVGPFASMEEAAGMCSGLKAAGGNCLVQKN